ncbi:hypothetical protein [Lactobacillus gigeriorum]|uniref:Uncharacterized protein n=1 Tax=Lactobacillus gigeriorum DSM 23908 = CRBIP 24.85 TaxID=1423751 RepID=A0ABR5PVU9_9LACO|nr:hypothetical protein [Lactobacillus gigeriorum]KRN13865.1 hypothetical protein FC38_GL001786 [Lactobacillus gigeriorum DSM 23908 = CRBIP 24.85]
MLRKLLYDKQQSGIYIFQPDCYTEHNQVLLQLKSLIKFGYVVIVRLAVYY